MEVVIEFDGACEPVNPGGTGAYGYILRGLPGFEEPFRISGVAGSGAGMTNNVAEYTALRNALDSLDAIAALPPDATLLIRGDSQLVVKQITREWRCNQEHLQKFRDECLTILERIARPWRAEWIPREQNAEADSLTADAYEKETGKKMPVRHRKGK